MCEFSVCASTFHVYLVDIVGVDACVEAHVEVVEHLHHLQRSTGRRDGGEAHDVGEKNGNLEQNAETGSVVLDKTGQK